MLSDWSYKWLSGLQSLHEFMSLFPSVDLQLVAVSRKLKVDQLGMWTCRWLLRNGWRKHDDSKKAHSEPAHSGGMLWHACWMDGVGEVCVSKLPRRYLSVIEQHPKPVDHSKTWCSRFCGINSSDNYTSCNSPVSECGRHATLGAEQLIARYDCRSEPLRIYSEDIQGTNDQFQPMLELCKMLRFILPGPAIGASSNRLIHEIILTN